VTLLHHDIIMPVGTCCKEDIEPHTVA